ncbi:MAG: DUF4013 domain-containing protein [Candidatus Altiarchaeota archaeon]|nr:DUF4013 domain-containing protein [Candidatus Altiarchaeota archaeon]
MEISDAIKKPFSDLGKLAIGSFLRLIPIVNLTVTGYGLQNAKSTKKLPEFSFDSFILGLKSLGVSIVYGLLTMLVMLPFAFGSLAPIMSSMMAGTFDVSMLMPLISVALIAIFVGILAIPLNVGAQLVLARTESMSEALNIPVVLKYAYKWDFIKYMLVILLVGLLVAIPISLVPFVGVLVAGYVVPVFTWTYLGANAPKN